jgi:hypothetical protein
MKKACDCTIKDFRDLPQRDWRADIGSFDSLVILPTKEIHDSGYRCMDFVAIKDGEPVCRLSGCSDVIHIDGIGGGGKNRDMFRTTMTKPWSIDCLPKSGLLQIFCSDFNLFAGLALSSFELFAEKRNK